MGNLMGIHRRSLASSYTSLRLAPEHDGSVADGREENTVSEQLPMPWLLRFDRIRQIKDAMLDMFYMTMQNWEISAASEKLAECQETILNLGRQLKALASPSDAALFDKVMSKPQEAEANYHHRALLDHMLAEDDEELESRSPNRKETTSGVPQKPVADAPNNPNIAGLLYGRKILPNHAADGFLQGGLQASPIRLSGRFYSSGEANISRKETDVGALAIVPKRTKTSVSLLRKILSRRKRERVRN